MKKPLKDMIENSSATEEEKKAMIKYLQEITLKKQVFKSSFSPKSNTITINEELMIYPILAHEYGHYLYEKIKEEDLIQTFPSIEKEAQDHFSKLYIEDSLIDNYKRKSKHFYQETYQKEENKFLETLNSLFHQNSFDALATLLEKTIRYEYRIKDDLKETQEAISMEMQRILNTYEEKEILSYIYFQYGVVMIQNRTIRAYAETFEPRGYGMFSDLCMALFKGNYYTSDLFFCHEKAYYEKEDNALNEQFANFVSLRLNKNQEMLEILRYVLGKEYYDFLETLYQKAINKLIQKQK